MVAFVARSQFPEIELEFFARERPEGLGPYGGDVEEFLNAARGRAFVVAIGDNAIRRKFGEAARGVGGIAQTFVHPGAIVAPDAVIGSGCVVMAGAVVHPQAKIGRDCIINTMAVVEHDCKVGPCVHLGPGAILAGSASVGADSWIGMGARVLEGRNIAEQIIVGAGAVVTRSLERAGTYVGVPATRIMSQARPRSLPGS